MKDETGNWLKVTGELQNCTNKSFNAVVFRITIFINNVPTAHTTVTINGFDINQARYFEKNIEDVSYSDGLKTALRCEIYPESVY